MANTVTRVLVKAVARTGVDTAADTATHVNTVAVASTTASAAIRAFVDSTIGTVVGVPADPIVDTVVRTIADHCPYHTTTGTIARQPRLLCCRGAGRDREAGGEKSVQRRWRSDAGLLTGWSRARWGASLVDVVSTRQYALTQTATRTRFGGRRRRRTQAAGTTDAIQTCTTRRAAQPTSRRHTVRGRPTFPSTTIRAAPGSTTTTAAARVWSSTRLRTERSAQRTLLAARDEIGQPQRLVNHLREESS